jgi:N-acetylglucosamine repressor
MIFDLSTKPDSGSDLSDVMRYIRQSVETVPKKAHLDKRRLLGVGISVPGFIDKKTKKGVLAPNLGWNDVDILSEMNESFGMPVYIENESMASAIYENWMGACREEKNFICVNIESGIGAGIFTGGEPYRGSGGSAGEVGHIQVDENGPKCGCGNYGCLETLASIKSMVKKAEKLVRQGTGSLLNSFENADGITFDIIVDAARKGDKASVNILNESARYLGIAISTLVNTLNPSRIVIGKDFVKYADLVMDTIIDVVKHKALKFPASMVDIVASEAGKESSSYGAAIIPLKVLFGK